MEAARKNNDIMYKLKEKNEELNDEVNRWRKDNALIIIIFHQKKNKI